MRAAIFKGPGAVEAGERPTTVGVLKERLAGFEAQADLAAFTDFPLGE